MSASELRGNERKSSLRERGIEILPGQYFDAETGLHQNWHRDYDPSTGRYLQSDPIGLAGGVSTYGYVAANPARNVDPMGLAFTTVDATCAKDPAFCGELFGQLVENAGSAGGNECLAQEAQDAADTIRGLGMLATLASVARALPTGVPKALPSPRTSYLQRAADAKLRNRIDAMYRENAKIGSGSTADAVRHELRTGQLLSPSGHTQKAIEMRDGLMSDIASGRLNAADTRVARELLSDLQRALTGG